MNSDALPKFDVMKALIIECGGDEYLACALEDREEWTTWQFQQVSGLPGGMASARAVRRE
jgi:hypothetical protein